MVRAALFLIALLTGSLGSLGQGHTLAYNAVPKATGREAEHLTEVLPERQNYIREFTERYRGHFAQFGSAKLSLMKYFEEQLLRYGMPAELKSLAYLESSLQLDVTSHAGARGPWQLMPGTATELGLRVDKELDERIDVVRSTHAAIQYLKKLHRLYDDWLLAVAAYNAGPGRINYALSRAGGVRDIRQLEAYLPAETRDYVRRFEAAILAWGGNRLDGILSYRPSLARPSVSESPAGSDIAAERKLHAQGLASFRINAGYRLDVIASALEIPESKLKLLNTHFESEMSRTGSTRLILPKDKVTDFKLHTGTILARCLQVTADEFE